LLQFRCIVHTACTSCRHLVKQITAAVALHLHYAHHHTVEDTKRAHNPDILPSKMQVPCLQRQATPVVSPVDAELVLSSSRSMLSASCLRLRNDDAEKNAVRMTFAKQEDLKSEGCPDPRHLPGSTRSDSWYRRCTSRWQTKPANGPLWHMLVLCASGCRISQAFVSKAACV
jgi:hypothetical protein